MNAIYTNDFSTSSLSSWTVEQHVPDGYADSIIRNNRLVFLDAGNRLLPNIPAIENFQLQCVFDTDWHINNHKFAWTVFFGYDTGRRQGPALEISSDGNQAWIKLIAPDRRILAQNTLDLFISDASIIQLEIIVQDQTILCKLNDQGCFKHSLPQSYSGLIALTRGSFLGELRLHSIEPYETAYDAISGKSIYAGRALPPAAVTVELKSPADKQICQAIPDSTPHYEQALAFAHKNHYFFESEECRFHFELVLRGETATNQFVLEYQIENAFFEPLTEYTELAIDSKTEHTALDIAYRHSQAINLGPQTPGVYHLRFRLSDRTGILHENYRAFEVIGARENAISASRLPKLFSMSNEVKGQDTDYFDPWRPDCVDVSHYISICTSIMPHFARAGRLWELLKIYKRAWFLWLGRRVMQDCSLENNRDLIEHCDYITPCNNPDDNFYRPCARGLYNKGLTRHLYNFALAHDFRATEIKACLDAGVSPNKTIFDALVDECFYRWLDFFWEARIKELQEFKTNCGVSAESVGKSERIQYKGTEGQRGKGTK